MPGPFYKIEEFFSQIGWSVGVPPHFADRDGFHRNLLEIQTLHLNNYSEMLGLDMSPIW